VTVTDCGARGRNLVVVVLDSLRYDTFVEARPVNAGRLGPIERRYSYATWTAPSHYNLLTGLLPHRNLKRTLASDAYRDELESLGARLGIDEWGFRAMLPSLFLPTCLKRLGYRTGAMVSMPVLNPSTVLNHDFDTYELMPAHNDLAMMIDRLSFDDERPSFWMLNTGETHYPYALPGDSPNEWPRIAGLHGTLRQLGEDASPSAFPTMEDLERLRCRQIRAAAHVDMLLERLYDVVPSGSCVVVTSDHGELFGEGGCYGHGPVTHRKVFEVPFVCGVL
jgi:arylsulfatase A-like enzyme